MNTNKYVGRVGIGEIVAWIALFIVFFFTITPILFMFVASFMDADDRSEERRSEEHV